MGRKTRERKARALYGEPGFQHPPGKATLALRWVAYPLLLVLLALAAYANSFDAPFILDDKKHIVKEAAIRPPVSLQKVLATSRPAVTASLALNYAGGKLDVRGYHVLNLIAHIVCGIVLYGFTRYTLRLPALRPRFGAAADHLAVVVAALFLLHPIQTESVTYVIQRGEIFAALALVAGLWTAAAAARAATWQHHLVGLVLIGIFGLLSKPVVIVLALLFALYDWCFIAEGKAGEMARRRRLYLVLLAVTVAAVAWGWHEARAAAAADFHLDRGFAWRYFTWQFGVVLYYLRLVVWPDRLCFDCGELGPWPVLHSALGSAVWLPAIVLGAGAVAAWSVRARHPLVTFAVLGSLIVLAPTSSVMPLADVYFEHRLYLPIGLLAMGAAAMLFSGGEAAWRRGWLPRVVARTLLAAGAVAACGALLALTAGRNEIYRDPLRLWQDSVAKAPDGERLQYNLANEYVRRGQPEMAIPHYQESIQVNPTQGRAYVNLGLVYLTLGRYREAVTVFETLREQKPSWPLVHRQLATAYRGAGRPADAVASAERLRTLQPRAGQGQVPASGSDQQD